MLMDCLLNIVKGLKNSKKLVIYTISIKQIRKACFAYDADS